MKIVIVDDDRLAVLSLKTIVEAQGIEVLGMGYKAEDAVKLYKALRPDILLMDIRMQGRTGLDAAQEILAECPKARILLLTTFSDDEYIMKALNLGVMGYILKQDFEGIVPALRAVSSGQAVFGEGIVAKIPQLMKPQETQSLKEYGITPKEQEIVELVARGMSNREIAGELFLSEGRVRNSLSVVLEKLSLRDRTQLAIFYHKLQKD